MGNDIEPPNVPKEEENKKANNLNKDCDIESLPKQLEPFLQDIPKKKKKEILRVVNRSISIQQSFSGPIPPPEILKGYNDIINDGAERILSMAEKQSNHRIGLEDYAVKEGFRQSARGQIFALLIGIIAILTGGYVAVNGQPGAGGTIAGLAITGLAAVFLTGRRPKD